MKAFIITGVGDHTRYIENRTKDWVYNYDLHPIALKFGWKGGYDSNYAALKEKIEKLSGSEKIAIIGISAGGSAAIRVASELENVYAVVTICARTSRGGFKLLSLKSFQSYWKSVDRLKDFQYNGKILIIKPMFDEIVSIQHMDYKDGKVLKVPYIFHIPSVLRILKANSSDIAEFIKQSST